ncbi:sensor domain-containing diguanylate cyclase [Mycolicibacterium baixiangningiae]|uniref:sensor domain-containing diguanylate cyclase n=1 Tax=Mycolicibacterium baixiangningiae TaxID=2761578 RepID=UPI001868B989|nr:GGDEF domain-containing protein [Mycolicibacterium baixiangningiae]
MQANSGFDAALRRRMLLVYLAILWTLYAVAVLSAHTLDTQPSDGRGELFALALLTVGVLTAARPPLCGWRYVVALVCVSVSPVAALLFHEQIAAQVWSVIPLMFVAMFLRTWHGPAVTRVVVTALAAAAVMALVIAPAPVPSLWFVFYVACIVGSAEIFGLANSVLVDAALRDPLTSVWNRAGVVRHATRVIGRARRRGDQVAVVVLDVDDFKGVNDRRGHAAGDLVLSGLAQRWVSRLPPNSVIGRVGGDEFVVLLGGSDEHRARALAAELVDGHSVDVTYGVAAGPAESDAFETLFASADEDLYRSKRARSPQAATRKPATSSATGPACSRNDCSGPISGSS